ncbi:MAG: transcription termination/antitermination protein NusA, partial [Anaerohalosphaera sp.]|nr:transcription termination/antitermination protein NusA [Anaerohalosphaera sp.]
NQELIRIVDNIARDKNISKESLFEDLEAAMISAAKKYFGAQEECEIEVSIDRATGQISAYKDGVQIDIRKLGRIPAQTAKQVMIQKIKADERDSVFTEFAKRKGEIINGTSGRYEGGNLVVNIDQRTEGVMPKTEQIGGETHHVGERIRCMIYDVREVSNQVKIILSRTHPDFIKRLFELEVPEVAEGIIEIKSLAREAGYRTKVAVDSHDDKVDAVGACVGVRGSRIRNIVDELSGEKIDIVRWSDSSQTLIANGLKPAEVSEIAICFELGRATVVVTEDQLSLAIGKHGQNVRLAARLTGWDIDILTPTEYNKGVEQMVACVTSVDGATDRLVDDLIALGIISVLDLEEVGVEPLIDELGIEAEVAKKIVAVAEQEAKRMASEKQNKLAEKLLKQEQESAGVPSEAKKELPEE